MFFLLENCLIGIASKNSFAKKMLGDPTLFCKFLIHLIFLNLIFFFLFFD
tara:strand:- start:457 stop:606 length:150 start_codon:yes stop_codon:yes gene_type:complete